ncbi:MAG TPA: glycoside hydrolase family 25 protein, partial [Ktedonobacteraceae bacterium]|nr:glycoside hydrolase family 25 protein [Ktedonobacteraceae bacterium]
MTGTPQFVDISVYQPVNIDWKAYRTWAAQWDGIARVSMRSSYGNGFTDQHFLAYREGALNAGIDVIIFYHYAYPQYNSAASEAAYQHQVVGKIRPNDVIMLDIEESVPQATASWAYNWLAQQEQNYGGQKPTLYASDSYIRERMQDNRLASYPLTLANWQFTPTEHPPCPPPWSKYTYLQYTDRASMIPGIAGTVDANLYLGGNQSPSGHIPAGWHDDGKTLTAPNGIRVVLGFRAYILATASWNPNNLPQEAECHSDPVLLHNTAIGAGQRQCFRDGMLWYTNTKGVVWEP